MQIEAKRDAELLANNYDLFWLVNAFVMMPEHCYVISCLSINWMSQFFGMMHYTTHQETVA